MNKLSLAASVLALIVAGFALICSFQTRGNGRFQMKRDDSSIGFDTKTGQVCLTSDIVKMNEIPTCKNLK